jgi:hypothetical protein
MGYFLPYVGFGKTDEKTLTGGSEPSAGDKDILFDNSGSEYEVGDLCMLAASDDTGNQFLGAATAVSPTQVTVTEAVGADQTTGATIWQPTTGYRFTLGSGFDELHRHFPGVKTATTRGGVVYSSQVADPVRVLGFRWESAGVPIDFSGFLDFLYDNRANGRESFAVCLWDHSIAASSASGSVNASKVFTCRYDFRNLFRDDEFSGLQLLVKDDIKGEYFLGFFVLDEDAYPTS